MKAHGKTFKRVYHLGWRMAQEGDKDIYGNDVKKGHVILVKISDCDFFEKDEKKYYEPKDASAYPIAYGGTNYGYGKWRKQNRPSWQWDMNKQKEIWVDSYWTCPMYMVKDSKVYMATCKSLTKPKRRV